MCLGILGGGFASYLVVSMTLSHDLARRFGPPDFAWWLAGGAAAIVLLAAWATPRFARGVALVLGAAATWSGVVAWGTDQGSYALPLLTLGLACAAAVASAFSLERLLVAPRT